MIGYRIGDWGSVIGKLKKIGDRLDKGGAKRVHDTRFILLSSSNQAVFQEYARCVMSVCLSAAVLRIDLFLKHD